MYFIILCPVYFNTGKSELQLGTPSPWVRILKDPDLFEEITMDSHNTGRRHSIMRTAKCVLPTPSLVLR